MAILRPAILLSVIILFAGTGSQVVSGDFHAPARMSVIVAQPSATAGAGESADMVESFLGLMGNLRQGQEFTFINAALPGQALGPARAGESEFRVFRDDVVASLTTSEGGLRSDVAGAIAESYNLLDSAAAAPGSTVYVIGGETAGADLSAWAASSEPVADLLRENGWIVVGLSLPSATAEMRGFLRQVSERSGGESFELSVPAGLARLTEKTLRDQAKGSLGEVGTGELASGDVLTYQFGIAPGTSDATLLFFKESPKGSLRLSDPSGAETSSGDRTTSSVTETPHVVIWRLTDPVPGQWSVEVRGIDGVVSAWDYSSNKYTPVFDSFDAVPLDQPSILIASVSDGQGKVTLDGVQLTASIVTPNGTTLFHALNDEGRLGDSVAGDGFYSATISPVAVEGTHLVDLELAWPEFGHTVSAQSSFSARPFPSIELTTIQTEGFRTGERSRVATLLVNVEGQPYAIATGELTAALASNEQQAGVVEIVPQRLLDQGRAWMFDVFFTPTAEALDTVVFRLNMDYAGTPYSHTSDFMVLSSMLPSPPVEPVVQAAAPVLPPPAPPVQAEPSSGFPMGLLAPLIAMAALLAAAVVYWMTRTKPYGYLYDDRNERVADFGALKRRPIMSLLFRSAVRGKELGVPGLEGVWFRFSGKRIGLRSQRATPTVRVNNQPLVGQTTIHDRTYIGTHGRLFTFLLSPMSLQLDPSAGDD